MEGVAWFVKVQDFVLSRRGGNQEFLSKTENSDEPLAFKMCHDGSMKRTGLGGVNWVRTPIAGCSRS